MEHGVLYANSESKLMMYCMVTNTIKNIRNIKISNKNIKNIW